MATRLVLEPGTEAGEWNVTVPSPEKVDVVFSGRALDCMSWCTDQGAQQIGTRVFLLEDAD